MEKRRTCFSRNIVMFLGKHVRLFLYLTASSFLCTFAVKFIRNSQYEESILPEM